MAEGIRVGWWPGRAAQGTDWWRVGPPGHGLVAGRADRARPLAGAGGGPWGRGGGGFAGGAARGGPPKALPRAPLPPAFAVPETRMVEGDPGRALEKI